MFFVFLYIKLRKEKCSFENALAEKSESTIFFQRNNNDLEGKMYLITTFSLIMVKVFQN